MLIWAASSALGYYGLGVDGAAVRVSRSHLKTSPFSLAIG